MASASASTATKSTSRDGEAPTPPRKTEPNGTAPETYRFRDFASI